MMNRITAVSGVVAMTVMASIASTSLSVNCFDFMGFIARALEYEKGESQLRNSPQDCFWLLVVFWVRSFAHFDAAAVQEVIGEFGHGGLGAL